MGTTLVDVSGSQRADVSFWASQCSKIPGTARIIRIDMGDVIDYFKPTGDKTLCEMLQSNTMHQWSPDGTTWETPDYHLTGVGLGGSAPEWPRVHGPESDQRHHLSFWGRRGTANVGGCCQNTYTTDNDYPLLRSSMDRNSSPATTA